MRKTGWMKPRLRALLHFGLAGWLVLVGAAPASADFWDDLARAAEAVVTGGLSEVARQLTDTIRRLIDLVTNITANLVRDANGAANAAADGIRGAAGDARRTSDQAKHDLNEAADKARHELDLEKNREETIGQIARAVPAPAPAGAPPSAPLLQGAVPGGAQSTLPGVSIAKTPTPSGPVPMPYPNVGPGAGVPGAAAGAATRAASLPADPAALLDAMTHAEQKVRDIHGDVARNLAPAIERGADTALLLLEDHLRTAADIARSVLEAPLLSLRDMLQNLIAHPEDLFNPTDLVNRQIDAINRSLVDTMNRITDEVTRDATRTLHDLANPLGHAHDSAGKATQIVDAMDRLRRDRTKAALDHLQDLVGPPGAPGAAVGVGATRVAAAHPLMLSRLNAKIDAGKIQARAVPARITQDLTRQWAEAQRLQAALRREAETRGDLAVYQRASADLAGRLGGKSPAQQGAIKSDLIREARRRFAGNPRVLEAAERIINQGAAPVGPPPPAVRQLRPGETRELTPHPLSPR